MTGSEVIAFFTLNALCWIGIPALFIQLGEILDI